VRGLSIVHAVWIGEAVKQLPIRPAWLQGRCHTCNSGNDRIPADRIGGNAPPSHWLGRSAFDAGVPDPEIFNMPIEFGLELVAVNGGVKPASTAEQK